MKILDISVNIVYNNECEKNYYPLYNRFSQKLSCCAAGRLFYVLCSEKYYHSFMSLIIKYFCAIIDIDKVPNYTYSISDFSDEEKLFYEKYVGCYIPERELSKEYLSSHLSEVQVNFIENGIVFWGFCKLKAGICYLEKEKQFFEYETFSGMPIKNVSEFKLSDFYDIVETGASSINALMFNARKEANQFNMIFFSQVISKSWDSKCITTFTTY